MSGGCQEAPSFLPRVTPTIYTFRLQTAFFCPFFIPFKLSFLDTIYTFKLPFFAIIYTLKLTFFVLFEIQTISFPKKPMPFEGLCLLRNKVCFIKIRSKCSSELLLYLLRIFMKQTLLEEKKNKCSRIFTHSVVHKLERGFCSNY